MINVFTVCTGTKYKIEYVDKMRSMLNRALLTTPFTMYSIVTKDGRDRLLEGKERKHILYHSWWDKLQIFNTDFVPLDAPILYLDLDQVLINPIDDLIEASNKNGALISCYSDHMQRFCKFGSALIYFHPKDLGFIYDEFVYGFHSLLAGGDQHYIEAILHKHQITPYYWDEDPAFGRNAFPAFKFDIVKKKVSWQNAKLVNFCGRPKMHEIRQNVKISNQWPWIFQYWK